jgi:Ni/Co efflux regulator RcnB
MNKSKSMAAVAAVLAMCMVGSAFAEDQRFDGGLDRHDQQRPRAEHGPGADRDHRDVRAQPQFIGRGYVQPYADWHRGSRLSGEYREMPS